MKKFAVCILAALLLTTSVVSYSEGLSEELSDGIVRLHIIAESDSSEDQAVKLKIRDAVLCEMDKFQTKEDIKSGINILESIANRILKENGFSYTAVAEYGKFEFPTKYYDNFALPKGEYEAVRIKLGKAEGQNWWCVLFPPLCMIDAATEESMDLLKETFGDNYGTVIKKSMPFKIKFKLAELF